MKTLIAIPCTEYLPVDFVECLSRLELVGDVERYMLKGSLIFDSRNRLAQTAIDGGFDYILWLDSDMIFEPDLLKRMLKAAEEHELVSAIFFTRKKPYKPCIYSHLAYVMDEDGGMVPTAEPFYGYPKDSTFMVEGFGFGAVITKVSAVEDILRKKGLPFSPRIGFGEDLTFCLKAKEAGYNLYCDSSIKVGHIGHFVINEELVNEVENVNNNQ